MTESQERHLKIKNNEEALALLGKFDKNITLLEDSFTVKIIPREDGFAIKGEKEQIERVSSMMEKLLELYRNGHTFSSQEFQYALHLTKSGKEDKLVELLSEVLYINNRGKKIKPKTLGQKEYISNITKNDVVFGIGPAGTGKTYMAMTMALASLKEKKINRLILTRPAVEAGEHLGFLPGDLQEKVDPYLRPLYDALNDLLGIETCQKYMEKGIIEVAPLAYMRGRSLDDSFVILDEAQNTTPEQMKMFLTRMGFGSRIVVTGDITQIDLPGKSASGLVEIQKILTDIKGISFVYLTEKDVVRHPIVQKIIKAYDLYQEKSN